MTPIKSGTPGFNLRQIAVFVVFLFVLVGPMRADADSDAKSWELVYEEHFEDDTFKERWRLEGAADLQIRKEDGESYLQIQTLRVGEADESVLWHRKQIAGDVRFTFRARGQSDNRGIFYFNANPTPASGFRSIFDWVRPDALMSRYAGDDNIMMYSVGILRDDQDACNLRFIGGPTAVAYRTMVMELKPPGRRGFGRETVLSSYPCPYLRQPETWFNFDLRVEGSRLTLLVDGREVLSVVDSGNVGSDLYAWQPLTNGGWFGLRNFQPKRIDLSEFSVFRKRKTAP